MCRFGIANQCLIFGSNDHFVNGKIEITFSLALPSDSLPIKIGTGAGKTSLALEWGAVTPSGS
jgi:hypothetical protein